MIKGQGNTVGLRPPHSYGRKYCQHDEEGIVISLFNLIGHGKTLCDIGARLNLSNSRRLIEEYGYTGKLIDMNEGACNHIREHMPDTEVIQEKITIENVNDYVTDVDFLSIDIDTNDWWVWAHVEASPRIVCIEYNNHFDGLTIQKYNPDMKKCNRDSKDGFKTHNASLDAMVLLGRLKGYKLAAVTGVNAIFVLEREIESLSNTT